jgi:A/G-specific adenine glycosylase
MELGALRCSPKRPQCLDCPIQRHCSAPDPESLPLKKPRQKTISITENAAWILANHAVLLEQQTGRRAGGLWKLPFLAQPPLSNHLLESVYPFTHHRVTLRVFEVPPPNPIGPSQCWFPTEHVLSHAALTAPHRRALESLLQNVI